MSARLDPNKVEELVQDHLLYPDHVGKSRPVPWVVHRSACAILPANRPVLLEESLER